METTSSSQNNSVIVVGGTGLIGTHLCQKLYDKGYEIILFTRDIESAKQTVPYATKYIDYANYDHNGLSHIVSGAYGIINLAGASIAKKRLTDKYKQEIYESRARVIKKIVSSIKECDIKPSVFVNASANAYYGFTNIDDEFVTEKTQPDEDEWSMRQMDLESSANIAVEYGTRVINMRTTFVLDNSKKGPLSRMLLPYKLFIGGPFLKLKWYRPWIHIDDEVNLFIFALENPNISGGVNASSPEPVTNKEFAKIIGKVLHKPSIFPVPTFILKWLVGDLATILTRVKRIYPKKALNEGFKFQYEDLEVALRDLLGK